MKKYRKLLLITIIILSCVSVSTNSFCVDSIAGEDRKICVDQSNCCKTIQFLFSNVPMKENVHIRIEGSISINGLLNLINFTNITIQGYNNAQVNCNATSGIYIENATDLFLIDFTVLECGRLQNSMIITLENKTGQSLYAVYITRSKNVQLTNLNISNSKGTGLFIYNTKGSVTIERCNFKHNKNPQEMKYPGGGGLKIELDFNAASLNTTYIIKESNFIKNNASEKDPMKSVDAYDIGRIDNVMGRGGGLFFNMRDSTSGISVNITQCRFIENTATTWGGGVYLSLRDNAKNNTFSFSNCNFNNNNCTHFGGGGLKISILSYEGIADSNTLTFANCNYTSNSAKTNGGGLTIAVTRENNFKNQHFVNNMILFKKCTWYQNSAHFGSAVYISPALWDILGNGMLPIPHFADCNFEENNVRSDDRHIVKGIKQSTRGLGTMFISRLSVNLSGQICFLNNSGTALYLLSAIAEMKSDTHLSCIANRANEGGAITLTGFSVIYLDSNIHMIFLNNTARIRGGAIYALQLVGHNSRSCFIQNRNQPSKDEHNVTIIFKGNTAKQKDGNTIYASSLKSCCSNNGTLQCIAHVKGLQDTAIETQHNMFKYMEKEETGLNNLIPGKKFKIPIRAYDELSNVMNVTYTALLENENMQLGAQNYRPNSTLFLLTDGHTNKNKLLLTHDLTTLIINISVTECPLGYILNNNVCFCDTLLFKGIWKCDWEKKTAWIINGYWIGLCQNDSEEQCTGHCPDGYCTTNITTELTSITIRNVSKLLCINNREGILCGQCVANNSVYYHSPLYKCGKEDYCKYGIVFYLLSEVVPLTIIFIVIIMLNVSFTNGAVNGIILYAQIFDAFIINIHTIEHFEKSIAPLTNAYKAIYTMSNMNYFSIDQLSFCLWQGATTLDIIAWKYFTIVYGFCLILVTVFLLNTTTCKKLCICWRPHNLKNAVIHGLTAFLVMCYSQCAKVSFLLLTTTTLNHHDLHTNKTVVLFSGENEAFDGIHSKYAIPALLFITVIVILPPLILFLYPLSFKLLALCHLSELKVVNFISNKIPMQLFDSFQSCYEDKFRFFSGLYFFYRIVPLILYAANTDMILFYFCVEVFLIMALALNATLQPYKNKWHNVTDSLIFTNLAIINAISLYNYQKINEGKDNLKTVTTAITITTTIQLILIYLPLLYIVVCFFWLSIRWLRKKLRERKISKLDYSKDILLDSTYLPPLRDRMSVSTKDDHEFHMMN